MTKIPKSKFDDQNTIHRAERSVIGYILISTNYQKQAMLDIQRIASTINFFTVLEHKHIYQEILKLNAQGKLIDQISLEIAVKNVKGILDESLIYSSIINNITETVTTLFANYKKSRAVTHLRDLQEDSTTEDVQKAISLATDEFLTTATQNDTLNSSDFFGKYCFDKEKQVVYESKKTNISFLDEARFEIVKGETTVIVAPEKVGKTTLALQIFNNLIDNTPSVFYSFEMGDLAIGDKLLAYKAGLNPLVLRTLYRPLDVNDQFYAMNEKKRPESERKVTEALKFFTGNNNFNICTKILDIEELKINIKQLVAFKNIEVAIIDQLPLIGIDFMTKKINGLNNETLSYQYITIELAKLARELNISIILIHQFNKRNADSKDKDGYPTLNGIAGSSAISKYVDNILLMYRDTESEKNVIKSVIISRNNPTARFECKFINSLAILQ